MNYRNFYEKCYDAQQQDEKTDKASEDLIDKQHKKKVKLQRWASTERKTTWALSTACRTASRAACVAGLTVAIPCAEGVTSLIAEFDPGVRLLQTKSLRTAVFVK